MCVCIRLQKIQTSSQRGIYTENVREKRRGISERPSTCYAKKTMALAKINYSPSFTAFRGGRERKERKEEIEKGGECVMKERSWTCWWLVPVTSEKIMSSTRRDAGGLLLASWFCWAQFCSRTTAKTRRIVMLKMRFAISRFRETSRGSRYLNKINVCAKEIIFNAGGT